MNMNRLWKDAEDICGTIKHNSTELDLDHVRYTMRRLQNLVDCVSPLLTRPKRLIIETSDDEIFNLTLNCELHYDQYQDLVGLISGIDYSD